MTFINKTMFIIFSIILLTSTVFAQTDRWRLIWDRNSEADMKYYEIFRDTHSNASTLLDTVNHKKITDTEKTMEYIDEGLEKGVLYFYRLKAVDSTELKSDFSDEVSAAIPLINIPNQSIYKNQASVQLSLDNYVTDPDHADNLINWEISGNSHVNINLQNRVATFTKIDTSWYGTEYLTFTATDPDSFFDMQIVQMTFLNEVVKYAPEVSDIQNQTIRQGQSFATINLDAYVSDQDNSDSQITWTVSGNSELTIDINSNRIATISPPDTNWIGSETITFTATDPDDQSDSDQAIFTVETTNAPIISGIPDQSIILGMSFSAIDLDEYVSDPDNDDQEITWTYQGNSNINVSISNRIATLTPIDLNWTGTDSIIFIATDPEGLSDRDTAAFTVNREISGYENKIFAYPIPLRPHQGGATEITFTNLPVGGKLLIYDLLGYLVYQTDIESTTQPWRTRNQHGKWVRSGVYLYVVQDEKGEKVKSDKVIIIR